MTIDRRTFLGTLAAGALAAPRLAWAAQDRRIEAVGVQLYSVRTDMAKDFEGTIAKIAGIGYKEVEFAGYFDHSPSEVKAILVKNGLVSPLTHIDLATISDSSKWAKTIDDSQVIGQSYIVMPFIDPSLRGGPDAWKKIASTLNSAGAVSKKAGIQLAYHNHNFEFYPVDGQLPYDILLKECDADLVKFEMDLCWIVAGGGDPLEYFARYPGRFPLVHVKDLKRMPVRPMSQEGAIPTGDVVPDIADVGSGIIDWRRILSGAQQAGIQHYIVEHDAPPMPFEDLAKSYQFLEALRF